MRSVVLLLVILSAGILTGCSGGNGGDGIDPKNSQILSDANTIAKSVGGDYSKLTDAQKQQFLKMTNGNEAQAKSICYMMVHNPNEGMQHGRPPTGK